MIEAPHSGHLTLYMDLPANPRRHQCLAPALDELSYFESIGSRFTCECGRRYEYTVAETGRVWRRKRLPWRKYRS